MCTVDGRRLRRFAEAFYAVLNKLYPRGKRADLQDGFIVVRLSNRPSGAIHPEAHGPSTADKFIEAYIHIGLVYFSPYRLSFQEMRLCREDADAETIGHSRREEIVSLMASPHSCRFGYMSSPWSVAPPPAKPFGWAVVRLFQFPPTGRAGAIWAGKLLKHISKQTQKKGFLLLGHRLNKHPKKRITPAATWHQ